MNAKTPIGSGTLSTKENPKYIAMGNIKEKEMMSRLRRTPIVIIMIAIAIAVVRIKPRGLSNNPYTNMPTMIINSLTENIFVSSCLLSHTNASTNIITLKIAIRTPSIRG